MKKTYKAPELFFEEYELSTSIAGNCGYKLYQDKVYSGSYQTCRVEFGGEDFVFTTEANGCTISPDYAWGEEGSTVCYEAYSTSMMLFNS